MKMRTIRPFKLVMLAMLLVSAVGITMMATGGKASADSCHDVNGYINCFTGYFYGGHEGAPLDNVMTGNPAIPVWVNSGSSFIGFISGQLNCTYNSPGGVLRNVNNQNSVGAAFIILTMMGVKSYPGLHPNRACAEFPAWSTRVSEWDRAGDIEWFVNIPFVTNTAYAPALHDVEYIGTNDSGDTLGIKFYSPTDPDRTAYSIRRACANPIGGLGDGIGVLSSPPRGNLNAVSCVSGNSVTGRAYDDDIAPYSQGNPSIRVDVWFYSPTENNGNPVQVPTYVYPRSRGPDFSVQKPGWVDWSTGPVEVTAYAYDVPGTRPNVLIGKYNFGPCIKPAATCQGATFTPAALDPNTPYTVRVQTSYRNIASPTNRNDIDAAQKVIEQSSGSEYIEIARPNGTRFTVPIDTITRTNNVITATSKQMPGTADTGTYQIYWGVRNGAIGAVSCPTNNGGKGVPMPVVDYPYFNVDGGDVSAGAGMNSPASGNDCTAAGAVHTNSKAGIVSWNKEAAGAYAGAGTDYAAMALNYLQDFATAQNTDTAQSTTNDRPDGLSFANVTTSGNHFNITNGMFGGMAGSTSCMPNYFDAASAVTGTYQVNPSGDLHLNASSSKKTIYVDGNAIIKNDVIYDNAGAYTNLTDIPNFSLVVRGNIFIDNNVSRIDGVLVAQPKADGSGGNIYTCAPNGTSSPALDKNLYAKCDNQLAVNGAVIAKQLWLLRTYGSINEGPAEQVNYTPEVWLTQPFTSNTTGKSGNYDAITSLPPVL